MFIFKNRLGGLLLSIVRAHKPDVIGRGKLTSLLFDGNAIVANNIHKQKALNAKTDIQSFFDIAQL